MFSFKSKIDKLKIEKVSQPKIFKVALLYIFVHEGFGVAFGVSSYMQQVVSG